MPGRALISNAVGIEEMIEFLVEFPIRNPNSIISDMRKVEKDEGHPLLWVTIAGKCRVCGNKQLSVIPADIAVDDLECLCCDRMTVDAIVVEESEGGQDAAGPT